MPDPYKRVQPGDEVTFSAGVWNDMIEAARAARARTGSGVSPFVTRQATVIRVKNESGGELGRNAVLGLEDPIFTVQDASQDAFLREVTFRGVTPDISKHRRRFCVLLDPATTGAIARAYVAGVCAVKVDVADNTHEYAGIVDGESGHLKSSRYGFAQILWREGDEGYGYGDGYDTGIQWAIVRLGAHCPSVAVGKASGAISAMSGSTYGTGSVAIYRSVGGEEDGPVETVDVLNPGTAISSGKRVSIAWDMDGSIFVAPLECE